MNSTCTTCKHEPDWRDDSQLPKVKTATPMPSVKPPKTSESLLDDWLFPLKKLVTEWKMQGAFLDNPHYHKLDRVAGRTYKECASALEKLIGI